MTIRPIAIVGARLHPITGVGEVDNGAVVIEEGKFVSVGPDLQPPSDARIIDAGGAIVTPGLMSAGTQLGLVEITAIPDTDDPGAAEGSLGAAFDVRFDLNPNSTLLPIARADGLTRALAFPGGKGEPPFAGLAAVLRLSEGPDLVDRPRAAMFVTGRGDGARAANLSRGAQWQVLRNALDEAKAGRRAAQGPAATAAREVLSGAIPLAIPATRESDVRHAVEIGRDYGVKVVIFGGGEAWRAAEPLARHQVPVVLNPFDDVPATFDEIGASPDNAALLHRAGVLVAFSIAGIHLSHNAGLALREAAGLAVANGLPWDEALKAVTVNPARIWGVDDHYGTVSPGMDADLVIWDGDPLEPASSPVKVFVRGLEVSLVTRQTLLRDRYSPARVKDPWPPAYR